LSRAFSISKPAAADLRTIAAYTERKWGRRKKQIYLGTILAAFRRIRDDPFAGRPYDHPRRRFFRIRVGRHVVYYVFDDTAIEIVRVLHDAMDAPSRLNGDRD
jgi:toxin ParE1/3/4